MTTRRRKPRAEIPEGHPSPERRSKKDIDPPFYIIFFQTAAVLLCMCLSLYFIYCQIIIRESDLDYIVIDDDAPQVPLEELPEPETPPPLNFTLTSKSNYDAYGLAQLYQPTEISLFWQTAKGLRDRFTEIYGGIEAARWILEHASTSYNLQHTACRLKEAKDKQRIFKFAFGGYSVTTGRGNVFSQSFPLVMESLLSTVFSTAGIEFEVRNAAIGGCPSFPYGWCMLNFWGPDPDVVSWDYAMNEAGGDASGIDAYLRYVMQLERKPLLIVVDNSMVSTRRDLLNTFVAQNILKDPLVIHHEKATKIFLDREEEFRPDGFREWRKFGAPLGAPGQAIHHPAKKEHEFLAWVIAMHFLAALELVVASQHHSTLQCGSNDTYTSKFPITNHTDYDMSAKPWRRVFYGEEGAESTRMSRMQCATSYEPILSGDLSSLVVAGALGGNLDIMLPRSMMYYGKAWVMDMSSSEKKAKQKLDVYGGLGFVDSKKAYYGVYASGSLQLLIPVQSGASKLSPKEGDSAKDWISSLIFCEVNEKRDPGACNTARDVGYIVGGNNATAQMIDAPGALFLGKKICNFVNVPDGARLTTRGSMMQISKQVLAPGVDRGEDQVGLAVEISVTNIHIAKREQACSVSHVIWELVGAN